MLREFESHPAQMSTSNIKTPITIRQGFVLPWHDSGNVSNLVLKNDILKWELSKLGIVLIFGLNVGGTLVLYYYKWLQLPFKTKARLRYINTLKNSVIKSDALSKVGLFGNKNKRKQFKQNRGMPLINRALLKRSVYQIPNSVQTYLINYIVGSFNITKISFMNIYGSNVSTGFALLNIQKFIQETPLIKSNIRSIYNIVDMIAIYDLLSLQISDGKLLAFVIGQVLERSTRKGLFIRSLRLLSKLPSLIKQFEIKRKDGVIRSWNWVIKVTGKLGGMGRTKTYFIRPIKLPLHTINTAINYSEKAVNTKAGTFSIKVWILN